MIIKYWSATIPPYIIEVDLSNLKIIEWEITGQLGCKPKGSLIINFDKTTKMDYKHTGIYPPVEKVINYNETIKFLCANFSKKRIN